MVMNFMAGGVIVGRWRRIDVIAALRASWMWARSCGTAGDRGGRRSSGAWSWSWSTGVAVLVDMAVVVVIFVGGRSGVCGCGGGCAAIVAMI